MFIIYADEAKTTTLLNSAASPGIWVESIARKDDTKGETVRTIDGTLQSWSRWTKYEDTLSLSNMQAASVAIIEGLIDNHTTVYYCPDSVNRSAELYTVKLDMLMAADYSPLSSRYSMQLKVREV